MNITISQPTISVRTFGPSSSVHDVILICLHGDDGVQFLKDNSFFYDLSIDNPSVVNNYIKVEQDVGSNELSSIIAHKLAQKGKRVKVIQTTIPRAILDFGRIQSSVALRPIFDYTKHTSLSGKLMELHRKGIEEIKKHLISLSPQGSWIDIHTMSPFNPKTQDEQGHATPDAVIPGPGKLQTYIREFTDPRRRGTRRPINLATHILGEKEHIACRLTANRIRTNLEAATLQHGYNCPHPMTDAITAAHLMKEFGRGLLIDFPKDYLCKGTEHECVDKLDQLELEQSKLFHCADALQSAFL